MTPAPPGVSSSTEGEDLEVHVRWRTGASIFNFVASFVLLAAPVPLIAQAPSLALVLVFPFFLVWIWALAGVTNHTTITFGRTLSTEIGPIPWPGAGPFPVERIEAFEVRGKVQGARRRRVVAYDLIARIAGTEQVLVAGIRDPERLRHAAALLEQRRAGT